MLAKNILARLSVEETTLEDDVTLDAQTESFEDLIEGLLPIEEMANPIMVSDTEVKDLDNMIRKGADKSEIISELVRLYKKYEPTFMKTHKVLDKTIPTKLRKRNDVKILTGLKPIDSIIDKALERGKGLMQLNDLVRGAILFDTSEDADKFAKDFIRKNKSIIVGYEAKEKGGDTKLGYYGSHHLDLNLDGLIVELQVMSRKLWSWKDAAHQIYNKYRSSGQDVSAFDRHMSNMMFSRGNQPKADKKNRKREAFEEGVNLFTGYELSDEASYVATNLSKLIKPFGGNTRNYNRDLANHMAAIVDMLDKGQLGIGDVFNAFKSLNGKFKREAFDGVVNQQDESVAEFDGVDDAAKKAGL